MAITACAAKFRRSAISFLGGRGLLFQRLTGLGQEPRVLHCDDSLGGEILQQRDLLVGELAYLMPVDAERG
jgi:hypothetical protein